MVYLNTLYIASENVYLNLEGETVVVTIENVRKLQVPLHHLESLVLLDTVRVSPPLLIRCMDSGISVVWLRFNGRFGARMEGPTSGNVLLRIAQHVGYQSAATSAELAREFIRGKLVNCRSVLMRAARESNVDIGRQSCQRAAQRVADAQSALDRHGDLEQLRGREGEAAAAYFGAFLHLIKPQYQDAFPFRTRQRRPPPDPINSLLSFTYALLLADCRGALETVGLDPQIGFLHGIRPRAPGAGARSDGRVSSHPGRPTRPDPHQSWPTEQIGFRVPTGGERRDVGSCQESCDSALPGAEEGTTAASAVKGPSPPLEYCRSCRPDSWPEESVETLTDTPLTDIIDECAISS